MEQLKFSIIIPNYNYSKYLRKAIESVAEQDYQNKEIIVIDGGSTDDSVSVIRQMEHHLSFWISERDKGTYDANNKGLKHISGDFWCVLNSDDILLPGALKTMAEVIRKNPNEKWFAGAEVIIDEKDNVTDEICPSPPAPVAGFTFLEGCWISHPTVFLHKDVIREVGEFSKWHIMDYNYWLRMEQRGFFPFIIKEKIAGLRIHSECKSYDQISLYQEALNIRFDFCKTHGLLSDRQVREKFRKEEVHIARLEVSEALMHGERKTALRGLFNLVKKYPGTVKERWFLGLSKRIVTGLKGTDPIYESLPSQKGTASWEYKT